SAVPSGRKGTTWTQSAAPELVSAMVLPSSAAPASVKGMPRGRLSSRTKPPIPSVEPPLQKSGLSGADREVPLPRVEGKREGAGVVDGPGAGVGPGAPDAVGGALELDPAVHALHGREAHRGHDDDDREDEHQLEQGVRRPPPHHHALRRRMKDEG